MSNFFKELELFRRLESSFRELGLLVVSDARRLLGGALGLPATELYVANYDTRPDRAAILVFEAGATGDSPPIHVIQPPADLVPTDVAVDDYGDVYLALADAGMGSSLGGSVAVFARGSAGSTPLRHIRGPATTLVQPVAVALDSARRVHVADAGRPGQLGGVVVFAPDADGDATPVARMPAVDPMNPVHKTGLTAPRGVAVDASGRIYVSGNFGQVLRFRALAGDEAPEAVLSEGSSYRGLAAFPDLFAAGSTPAGGVTVFPLGAPTGASPLRRFWSNAVSGTPVGLAVSRWSGAIYLTSTNQPQVAVFSLAAVGNTMPIAILAGPSTGLTNPAGIAVAGPLFSSRPPSPPGGTPV